jgi:HEPN domain-containing protein
MQNESLVQDYLTRCRSRLLALDVLFQEKNWPDVVRESQEAVELALKAVLRAARIEAPRVHDVSSILQENESALQPVIRKNLAQIVKISKSLRKDRELAFYGTEDLSPLEFYSQEDAEEARNWARQIVEWAREACG